MNKNIVKSIALIFISSFFLQFSYAQSHKGISFQGLIKMPNGDYPNKTGVTINARILSPNNCILREEEYTNLQISDGYLTFPVGTGTPTGDDPGLSLKQVMDNSSVITGGPAKPSGLVCLDSNGNTVGGVTTFDPSVGSGARKLRVTFILDGTPILADFNMRSTAFAINAEVAEDAHKLSGKSSSDFVQTSGNITQTAVEAWFSSVAMGQLIGGTYNAPTATSAVTASALSSTLPINRGGTNLTSLGTSNQVLGVNSGASALEYKTITAGTNITINHSANAITISAAGAGAETDPTVQTFAKNAPSTGLTVTGNQLTVSYGTTAGTAAQGNDSRITGAFQTSTNLTGDITGNLPSPTVSRLNGVAVSNAVSGDNGKFLKYSSASSGSWSPQFITLSDLKNTMGTQSAFSFAGCTPAQTLTWSSVTDQMTCEAINGVPAANITGLGALATKANVDLATGDATGVLPISKGGTGATTVAQNLVFVGPTSGTNAPSFRALTAADLPASASYWSAATGGISYSGGKVGIGTDTPDTTLDTSGGLVRVRGGAGFGTFPGSGVGLELGYDSTSDFGLISSYSRTSSAYKGMYFDANPLLINGLSNANVGIGTFSTQALLHVGSANDKFALFSFNNGTTIPASNFGLTIGGNNSNGGGETNFWNGLEAAGTSFDFKQKTGAATFDTLMTLKSNGRVGVGTTNPSAKLHVDGEGHFGNGSFPIGALRVSKNDGDTLAAIHSEGAAGRKATLAIFGTDSTNNLMGMEIRTDGVANTAQIVSTAHDLQLGTNSGIKISLKESNGFVGIGTTNPGQKLEVNGTVLASGYLHSSDRRLKKNIQPIAGLDIIRKLTGVHFTWREKNQPDIGFIAQDVEAIAPELVSTDPTTTLKSVKYAAITAPLVEAVKEVDNLCKAQSIEIDNLKAENRNLKQMHQKLETEHVLLMQRILALEQKIQGSK